MKIVSLSFFFFSLVLLQSFAANAVSYTLGVSSFFWLKPGTQACYAFSGDILFDDEAVGYPFGCNYSWTCLEINETHTVLDVGVNIELFKKPEWTHPAYVEYFGTEFLEKAATGDLSFVKRIPLDQVISRFELYNSSVSPGISDGIGIPSPITIDRSQTVTVDLDNMMMIDEHGQPWGKWLLWIDPLKYPLEGQTQETIVVNWLGRSVDANISYVPSLYQPIGTIFGQVSRCFDIASSEIIEDEFLSEHGFGGMIITYFYEPRTGILLRSGTAMFFDDFLAQQLGIVKPVASEGDEVMMNLKEITFVGDLNSDWQVNISDIAIVAVAFNSRPGDQRWNEKADVNKDSVINIVDVSVAAKVFGTQYIIPQ